MAFFPVGKLADEHYLTATATLGLLQYIYAAAKPQLTKKGESVAIAAQWQTVATGITTSAQTIFTTAASTAATFAYQRDLVVCNSGASTVFIGMGASNVATSVASFQVPSGGSVLLTQCQVPGGVPITAITGAGTTSVSVGYALNVSYA